MLFHQFKEQIFSNNRSYLFNLVSLMFIFLPLSLATGPFLPDFFLSMIALYFLCLTFKNKLFNYYKNIFVYIFGIFVAYIIINGLFSSDPYSSLILYNGPLFYFRYLFFILGAWYLIDQNPNLIKYFTYTLVFVILFVIVDGLFQWSTGVNFFGFTPTPNRIPGVFNDEEILGHFLAHVVPLAFALLLYMINFGKKQIILLMLFLVLSEVMIFITNDRAGFLRIFQFTLLLIFLSNRFKLFRIISFLISLILIAVILNFSTYSQERYIKGTIAEVTSTKIPYMPWSPMHERHFGLAFNFFKESPIFGNGPQFFKYTCINEPELFGCTTQPHNIYFQTLAELGIVGLSFLILGFLYVSFILFKQFLNVWFLKKDKLYIPDYLVSLYSLTFIFLWPLIPHGSFYNNWINSMIFLPVPFILYFRKKFNNQKF